MLVPPCSNNPHILGANNKNLPRIAAIFGTIVDTDAVSAATNQRVIRIWQQLQTIPQPMFQQLWTILPLQCRQRLAKHTNPALIPTPAGQ